MDIGFKLDLEVAGNASKGGRIVTGVYKVEIVKALLAKTENGNNILDLELRSENGEVGFINRLCIDEKWTSGSENLDYKRWQELAACAGMQSLTTFKTTRKTGKGEIEVLGIKELTGKVVNVAVYQEHDVYNNEEKISLKLSNTFLASGQSVTEAQTKKPADRILKVGERLADFHTAAYKNWKSGAVVNTSQTEVQTSEATIAQEVDMATEEQDDLFG
jgi:hypothetical protein